ncbi:hypothetical protein FSARC_12696 [Fusarium sarcochroum]|uniref:Uncharacterized protein n=1 Tax=Fusarium sarcochroum TaxID=1208366 RepID=A0A8H4WWC1_9HYPO|nr:hypothetical protein FSARC_12696 [Fusarium sarcochroum]
MLASIRDAAMVALAPSSPLDKVLVTHPPVSGLAYYDISDALEHINLRSWLALKPEMPQGEVGWPVGYSMDKLAEAHAVMGTYGLGVCENYEKFYDCDKEEGPLPREKVMVAGLTEVDLRAEAIEVLGLIDFFDKMEKMGEFIDLEAGLTSRHGFTSEKAYWNYVGSRLESLAKKLPTDLTRIMLVGENSTHPTFLRTLREAMERSGHGYLFNPGGVFDDRVSIRTGKDDSGMINPTFASARGAAKYARRRQELELWPVCQEGIEDALIEEERGRLEL